MQKRNLTAVQTSGGMGTRLRPLNLESLTSSTPKGLMRIMGLPIAEIQIREFKSAGIEDVYIITQFLENRQPLQSRFRDGASFGLRIHYSDPSDDEINNGSGDAILTNIEKKGLDGDSIWLPNDNLFEYNFEKLVKTHQDLGAVVTMMTITMNPNSTIGTYGLLDVDPDHKVLKVSEKPESIDEIKDILKVKNVSELDSMRIPVNTAGYILNNEALAKISKEDWVIKERKKSSGNFDMAGKLITGLVEKGYPVYIMPIDSWGDFGTRDYFLDTFPDALTGKFSSIYKILENQDYYHDSLNNVWIHPDSLNRKDKSGKTLKESIEAGKVKIGPNVFIGRGTIIENDAEIRYSDIEKNAKIGRGALLDHAYLSSFCDIGPYSNLRACALGLHVKVESSKKYPTSINGRSVLGPKISVPKNNRLSKVIVFPGYVFGKEELAYDNQTLYPTDDQIVKTAKQYR